MKKRYDVPTKIPKSIYLGNILISIFMLYILQFMSQLSLGFYGGTVIFSSMALGVLYGYKVGINNALVYDFYPLNLVHLEIEDYVKSNDISTYELTLEEEEKLRNYDLENDKIRELNI